MTSAKRLQPCRHDPPAGWSREVFSRLTDAIAAALVGAVRRAADGPDVAVEAGAVSRERWRASRDQDRGRPRLVTKDGPAP
jgi:hypothetical protein